jgi:hypothetical protein
MNSPAYAPGLTFTPQARKLGIIAAWTAFAVNEVYAIASAMAYVSQGKAVESGPYLSVMALLVVLMGPFLLLSMVAIHAYASPDKKTYSLAALIFMTACVTITSCINFLLLMVSSRPELFSEAWRALFLPCVWPAPAFVLDNFVWDWFFGIAMLMAVPVFSGSRLKNALRWLMVVSGTLCIVGLLWIAVSPAQAIMIGILGWGAAGPFVFVLLGNLFIRVQAVDKEPSAS